MGPVLEGQGPGRGAATCHPGPERAPRRWQPRAHVRAGAPLAGGRGGAPARGQAAHGAVARPRPRRRRVPPGRRQGDPRQPGLRRAPAQPRRLRPHVPPLHRLRRARALLARAPPRGVGPPVRPQAGRRLRAVPRARRRRRRRGAARRRGGRRGAARRPPARVALLHHAVRVRQGVRRVGAVVVRRGGGASGDGARRVRAPREGELVRLFPGARHHRPPGHRGPVRRAHAAGEPLRARHHPRAPRQGDDRHRRRRGPARLRGHIAFPAVQRGAHRRRHRRRALGDDLQRDGRHGSADGVDHGAPGPPPRRAGKGAPRARRGGRPGQPRRRVVAAGAAVPAGADQGGSPGAPAGAAAVVAPQGHHRHVRGRPPRPGRHDRHGEPVGHEPRPGGVGRAARIPAGAVPGRRRGPRRVRAGRRRPARAVRVRPEELSRQVPGHNHRDRLDGHPAARVRVGAAGVRRRPVGGAPPVVRDGGAAPGAGAPEARRVMWSSRHGQPTPPTVPTTVARSP